MVKFFGRLFGREDRDIPVPVAEVPRKEDPEILALREGNFRKNLDAYLHRSATEAERRLAYAALIDPNTGNLKAIGGEEMRACFTTLDLHPDAEPDNVINGKEFEPRGNRQSNFEAGLTKALGRRITDGDIADAQEFIDSIPARKEAFETMTGEQAAHYAATVVRQMTAQRLRNPGEGQLGYSRKEAAK